MRLSPTRFNRFIAHIGQTMRWRRAFACPCTNAYSGAARADCPVCSGKGRTWAGPLSGRAGVSGLQIQQHWAKFGTPELGDVVITVPSDSALYAMGQFDRVTFSDSSQPFSITLTRGDGDVIDREVAGIDRVFWLAPDGESIVEGGIPTVAADGSLSWEEGEPPMGVEFSITGRRRPEYFVFDNFPQDRAHHHGASLPRRVVLRVFDLYGR